MKRQELIMLIAFSIALFANAVGLLIDDFKADTFVCNDKILAEELTPLDIQELFKTCNNRCKDIDCTKSCADMISNIVKSDYD